MKKKYRIVTDAYCGFEVQHKYWWFPMWFQTNQSNSHVSVRLAEVYIEEQIEKDKKLDFKSKVVLVYEPTRA